MKASEIQVLVAGIAPVVRDLIDKATAPLAAENKTLLARLDALEKRLDSAPMPKDGKDADPEAVAALVYDRFKGQLDAMQVAVDAIEPAPEMPELPDIPAMIEEAVTEAMKAIPAPKDGKDGAPGPQGEPGRDGQKGADGRLPLVEEWIERVHYAGEVVALAGATWQAKRDTGKSPPHDDWTCIAAPGRDGRSLTIRGTFDATAIYEALDVVALNGGSFVTLSDDPGECPGEGWQLLTSPGKRGQKGEDGARGAPGPRGESGPAVIAGTFDGRRMVLTNDDGSEVSVDMRAPA